MDEGGRDARGRSIRKRAAEPAAPEPSKVSRRSRKMDSDSACGESAPVALSSRGDKKQETSAVGEGKRTRSTQSTASADLGGSRVARSSKERKREEAKEAASASGSKKSKSKRGERHNAESSSGSSSAASRATGSFLAQSSLLGARPHPRLFAHDVCVQCRFRQDPNLRGRERFYPVERW
jgi:hypothetical protein